MKHTLIAVDLAKNVDGQLDLVIQAKNFIEAGLNEYGIRVYESPAVGAYPTDLVWERVNRLSGWSRARIADTDLDGTLEIVAQEPGPSLAIYEPDGAGSFAQVYSLDPVPGGFTGIQSFQVLHDLDGDGWDEILFGGYGAGATRTSTSS